MNQYGTRALEHWRRYAPDRVAALDSPEAFFTDLGAEIAGEVSDLSARLENNPALLLEMTRSSRQDYLRRRLVR